MCIGWYQCIHENRFIPVDKDFCVIPRNRLVNPRLLEVTITAMEGKFVALGSDLADFDVTLCQKLASKLGANIVPFTNENDDNDNVILITNLGINRSYRITMPMLLFLDLAEAILTNNNI